MNLVCWMFCRLYDGPKTSDFPHFNLWLYRVSILWWQWNLKWSPCHVQSINKQWTGEKGQDIQMIVRHFCMYFFFLHNFYLESNCNRYPVLKRMYRLQFFVSQSRVLQHRCNNIFPANWFPLVLHQTLTYTLN